MLHCERDGFFFNWAVTAGWRPALRCRILIESCAFSTRQWRNFTEHDSTLVRWWVLLRQKYSPRRKNLFWIGRSSQSSTSNQKILLIIFFFFLNLSQFYHCHFSKVILNHHLPPSTIQCASPYVSVWLQGSGGNEYGPPVRPPPPVSGSPFLPSGELFIPFPWKGKAHGGCRCMPRHRSRNST